MEGAEVQLIEFEVVRLRVETVGRNERTGRGSMAWSTGI